MAAVAAMHAEAVDRQGRFPREAVEALAAEPLLGVVVPRPLGGEGTAVPEVGEIAHPLGRHFCAAAMVCATHRIRAARFVRHGRDNPLHPAFPARLAAEHLLLASATSEAGTGGDLRSSRCSIERCADRIRCAENATVVSCGEDARGVPLTARWAPDAPSDDPVLRSLQEEADRLERTTGWKAPGMRETRSDGFWPHADAPADRVFSEPFGATTERTRVPVTHAFWSTLRRSIAGAAVARTRLPARFGSPAPERHAPGAERLVEAVSRLQAVRAAIADATRRWETASGALPMALALEPDDRETRCPRECLAAALDAVQITGLAGFRNDGP